MVEALSTKQFNEKTLAGHEKEPAMDQLQPQLQLQPRRELHLHIKKDQKKVERRVCGKEEISHSQAVFQNFKYQQDEGLSL
ncbi:hypothetical protein NECAME_15850 [Necator americanus]|uniref:Uncharacterized protein n=1 Tax=Necator americanus TaxID=51031 RepID=W2SHQ2_NECAM|nr:hypothetical protein NECAME_15850 [Necator americanus]ETN68396.1 hypothetical protein NECAME_15850 [Necator americanus]